MIIYLHIGYHRTATTWLQKNFFPVLDGLTYVGRIYQNNAHNLGWINPLSQADDNQYLKRELLGKLNPYLGSTRPLLLSDENFLRPGRVELALARLADLFLGHEVRFIITVRRQSELIGSRYRKDRLVHPNWKYSLEQALDQEELACVYPLCKAVEGCACRLRGSKSISLPFYDYDLLETRIRRQFASARIHFTVLEALATEPVEELTRLKHFLGASIIDLKSTASYPPENKSFAEPLSLEMTSYLFKQFKVSNSKFEQRCGVNVSRWGYC